MKFVLMCAPAAQFDKNEESDYFACSSVMHDVVNGAWSACRCHMDKIGYYENYLFFISPHGPMHGPWCPSGLYWYMKLVKNHSFSMTSSETANSDALINT